MGPLEALLQSCSSTSLLGALLLLLLVYFISSFLSGSGPGGTDPPGPRPLPLLGNLLLMDLQRPYRTLMQVRLERGRLYTPL